MKRAPTTKTPAKNSRPSKPAASPPAPRRRKPPAEVLPAPEPDATVQVSAEELGRMIAEAAYYRALQRGFAPGFELDDWVAAEAQIKVSLERR